VERPNCGRSDDTEAEHWCVRFSKETGESRDDCERSVSDGFRQARCQAGDADEKFDQIRVMDDFQNKHVMLFLCNGGFAERATTTSKAFSRGFLEETDEFGERADNGTDRSRAIRTTSRNTPGLWQRQLPPFGQYRLSFLPGLATSTYHVIHKMGLW